MTRWELALVVAALGCGGEVATTFDASSEVDAESEDASSDSGGFYFGDAASVTPEAALVDVYVPLEDGGGPFLCEKDVCDGRTHYCDNSSAGPDLGPATCRPLPDGCVPANCECLPNANLGAACSCKRATTGDGLIAGCQLP